jgi:NADH-quinone oxidoreductase subunit C
MIDIAPILARFPSLAHDPAANALIVPAHLALEVARYLRDNPAYLLDYASNVTGVDYLATEKKSKVKQADGVYKEIVTKTEAGMEVVYHLYSMHLGHGPLVLKQRTSREKPVVTSLTPVYRGAEFQEREVFDLFGIHFDGHPDLRRILMWDEFKDYPMRKDYIAPDDFQYEPTPHGDVLAEAQKYYGLPEEKK